MKKTLLEQAMETTPNPPRETLELTDELLELAIAWVEGKIVNKQFTAAVWPNRKHGAASTQIYTAVAISLRDAALSGKLKLSIKDNVR